MRKIATSTVVLLILANHAAAQDRTAAKEYQALLTQYEEEGGTRIFAKRFLDLAKRYPQNPASADALLWVVSKVRGKDDTAQALALLHKQHVTSEKLGAACKSIGKSRSVGAATLLCAILGKNPNEPAKAQAAYHLALLLDQEATLVEQLAAEPELAPRVLQYYGKKYGKHLSSLDRAGLEKQREKAYQQLLTSFPDVEIDDTTMGKLAEQALFAIRHLSVGRAAPEIAGEDVAGQQFKLSDYRGKIVMLSFWGHW